MMRRIDLRNSWICVAVVALAILASWPVAEISFGDDTAYAHLAMNVARTGHFSYNGWETNVLALHAYWGALLIHLFGFSFNLLRLSTIPLALGALVFCYLLVRRGGLQPARAVFVTLLLGLCPIFIPFGVTYMTDVPGLFYMLASLFLLTRAAEESANGNGYGWLALGVAVAFLGGTGRQVVWLVPLIVLPYLAWLRRGQVRFALAAVVSWLSVFAGMELILRWFNQQLYAVPQLSPIGELLMALKKPLWEINVTARLVLMILLLCLPAALPIVVRASIDTVRGTKARKLLVGILLLGVFGAVAVHPSLASIPWITSTLNWEGINGSAPLPGRPIVLTWPIRALVALAVYVSSCILAGEVTNIRELARRAVRPFVDVSGRQFALAAMSLLNFLYCALLVVRLADIEIFDRYLLLLLPGTATVLLLWAESRERSEWILQKTMPFAWALLAVFAFYGIASTQDYWALARARVTATGKLEAAGVPRTAIDAGFEYNAWTELQVSGRINSRWVVNPAGFYRPDLSQTPSVVPQYRLEYEPSAEAKVSEFGSVPYVSFLPPFHKQVSIDRILKQ